MKRIRRALVLACMTLYVGSAFVGCASRDSDTSTSPANAEKQSLGQAASGPLAASDEDQDYEPTSRNSVNGYG
jgi:hypothetical protein